MELIAEIETQHGVIEVTAITEEELICKLREKWRLSMEKIGSLLEPPRSRQYIFYRLKKWGKHGPLRYPELRDPTTYEGKTDQELADELLISPHRVAAERRELGVTKPQKRFSTRLGNLTEFMFGPYSEPTTLFEEIIIKTTASPGAYLSEEKIKLLKPYYTRNRAAREISPTERATIARAKGDLVTAIRTYCLHHDISEFSLYTPNFPEGEK